MEANLILITGLIFLVAILYSSVGHGGASGYLAVMSFFAYSPDEMASTALILNVVVAGLAFHAYWRAGHFRWALTWPFLLASIPMAFLGGLLKIPVQAYYLILAAVLLFAAGRLSLVFRDEGSPEGNSVPMTQALASGGGIGIISGMIGVGGGIFLSPLMLLLRWAEVKHVAATSAIFILANAVAGLGGRYARDGLVVGDLWPFLIAGFLGGLIGSWNGARRFSNQALKRVLAIVLVVAAVKLVLHAGAF